MNSRPDFDDQLREWAELGDEQLPARYLEAALAQVETTAQRGVGWWPLKELIMKRPPLAALAFLGAAALVVGLALGRLSPQVTARPSATPSPSAASIFAGTKNWITYRSGATIASVDPRNPTRSRILTTEWAAADPVSWSADGTRLLLVRDGDFVILRADGEVTSIPGFVNNEKPTWGSLSPDGNAIVFAIDGSSGGPYIVSVSGGEPRSLLTCRVVMPGAPASGVVCGEPLKEVASWSPDGSTIAWIDFMEDSATYGHHAHVLSFVRPDGTGLREGIAPLVAEQVGEGQSLAWSPDGSRLAFWVAGNGTSSGQIHVVNADGSDLRRLTSSGDNRWPSWSPDGSRLAFVRDGLLSTMAADGTDVQPVGSIRPDGAIVWNPG